MKHTKILYALVGMAVAMTTGCASIVNDSSQAIKVDTLDESGKTVSGAECQLSNDFGQFSVRSGNTAMVHRSSKDLDIVCKESGMKDGTARAVSRANAGMAGNIIFGGGIGAIIDHNKGTAYTYPTWVQLQFGKTLVFDRSMEKDGMPVPGAHPTGATAQK
ncbi:MULTISPECIES: hypothetical protein [Ramlibacter]|uniref:Lipoprotein n=1 Tax=Ramlibacter aquaticus TaxID=2780094 RepID=A0ABR9SIN0_9BURK|nr:MULTISPECIES: hypothetical protein [Ramlibacter]MBE7942029.1 hypothetical protein [Ramlibacter aquaticus]